MEEKIKISIPKVTLELLKKDCEDFKILKSDEKINMNAFINTLIVNYYEEFSAGEESLHNEIQTALFSVPSEYRKKAFDEIIKIFTKRNEQVQEKCSSASLSFKPTKSSESVIRFIDASLIKNESVSSFYRRMLVSYSKKTKNEREKIIHKENFELLTKAIEKGVDVCIMTKTDALIKKATVYAIGSSKDELFNYILSYDGENNNTLRLSNVKSVTLLGSKNTIPNKNKALFDRQIESAIQYPMYFSDNEPIKVLLTDKGKKLFKKIYLYRPTPVSIKENVYTFNCSANQLIYYFQRFGDSALILSPKKLGITMRGFYHFALKKYRELYGKPDF